MLRLAGLIEWVRFEQEYGALYAEQGRPGLPTRLMVGLHLLKHIKALSDEQVCAQWVENPYFQAFCGETCFQHELPLERSSMSRWRERIGPDKIETVLAASRGSLSTRRSRSRQWRPPATAISCIAASNG
ncbi:MAG: transposase [Stellaceae bacterium]